MGNAGNFKKEMQRSVLRKIIILLIQVSLFFVIALLMAAYLKNEHLAQQNLTHIRTVFTESFETAKAYLIDEKTQALYTEIVQSGQGGDAFQNSFSRFNLNRHIRTDVIIVTTDWDVLYSSYPEDEMSAYHSNYNNAISYQARNLKDGEVYTAVYYENDSYSDYMIVKPIFIDDSIEGYITLYLSGDDWSYYMSHYTYDGVITDARNNVVFYNRSNLIENTYKFDIGKGKIVYIGGERYWLAYEELTSYGLHLYSLIYYPRSPETAIGLIVIVIIGVLWYKLANQMAETMAEKNAASIEHLLKEIRIIRKYDQKHRIVMDTKDEFEDVGQQINHMLDTIEGLNAKNTELIQLNNAIEINQLTAQINPHFLYNTLEIIRNLLYLDAERASELIVQLTQVLRYSINNTKREVIFREDMRFLEDYLSIQKSRFGERLKLDIDIEALCYDCVVPKLILQPIIENSIKYGFMKKMNIRIEIKGRIYGDKLYLSVQDDGLGMTQEAADQLIESIQCPSNDSRSNGLYNTARRLKLQHSDRSGMEIVNREGDGVKIILRIWQPGV